jgi:hypothetical protein
MVTASVRTGTPAGEASRSRARRSSRNVIRGTIATATDPNRAVSAALRLPAYTRDEWLDQLPTTGALTRFPPGKLAEVLETVGAAIDAIGGSFPVRYSTVAVVAARAGAA